MARTRFIRPRFTDTTCRCSPGSASRAATMLEPPPNGITTALAATTASTIRATSSSLAG